MNEQRRMQVNVTGDGPYVIMGDVPLSELVIVTDSDGQSREWRQGRIVEASSTYRLCRCGHSDNKPFCDDTHQKIAFDGTETASREPYLEQAATLQGPAMALTDAENLCAYSRFCDPDGSVWRLVKQTNQVEASEMVKHEAGHCVGGRLVAWNKERSQPYEPDLDAALGLVEDPQLGVSGPIRVMGDITVRSGDGTILERRNRIALCRCGESSNKPFCDGTHASVGFVDGSPELH